MMMGILKKTTVSMEKSAGSIAIEQFDIVEDLSSWEIVDASESDDEDLYSLDGIISEEDEEKSDEDGNITNSRDFSEPDDIIPMQSQPVSPTIDFRIDGRQQSVYYDNDDAESKKEERRKKKKKTTTRILMPSILTMWMMS